MTARNKTLVVVIFLLAVAAALGAAGILYYQMRDPIAVLEAGARPAWAEQKLTQMAIADPDNLKAQDWLIRLALENGDMSKAQNRLDALKIKAPGSFAAAHGNCMVYIKLNDWKRAADWCERSLKLSSRSLDDLNMTANSFLKVGKLDQAIPLLEEVRKKTPNDPKLLNNLGYYYMMRREYDQAIALFNQALSLDPEMQTAKRNLARTYHRMGKYKEAIDQFKVLLAQAPNDIEAMVTIASIAAVKFKDVKTAREYLEMAKKNGLDNGRITLLEAQIEEAEYDLSQSHPGQTPAPGRTSVPASP
jgi:tetratricopeptide (TPR) repeat protein